MFVNLLLLRVDKEHYAFLTSGSQLSSDRNRFARKFGYKYMREAKRNTHRWLRAATACPQSTEALWLCWPCRDGVLGNQASVCQYASARQPNELPLDNRFSQRPKCLISAGCHWKRFVVYAISSARVHRLPIAGEYALFERWDAAGLCKEGIRFSSRIRLPLLHSPKRFGYMTDLQPRALRVVSDHVANKQCQVETMWSIRIAVWRHDSRFESLYIDFCGGCFLQWMSRVFSGGGSHTCDPVTSSMGEHLLVKFSIMQGWREDWDLLIRDLSVEWKFTGSER